MTCDMPALEKLLSWRLHPLADHIDFEDMKQECRIAAWRAVTNHRGGVPPNRLIVAAIDAEAIDFLRSPMNRKRTRTRNGFERVAPVTLSLRYGPEETDGWPYPEPEPRTPDFVVALVDRAYAAWIWGLRQQLLTRREIEALEGLVMGDSAPKEVALSLGRCESAIYNEKNRALGRYRAFLQGVTRDE